MPVIFFYFLQEANAGFQQSPHLLLEPFCIAALSAASTGGNQPKLAHEGRKAMP